MSNKFSNLNDFKINRLVAEHLGYTYACDSIEGSVLVEGISTGIGGFKKIILCMNYCSDYKNAFELMIENAISLEYDYSKKCWHARDSYYDRDKCVVAHENPCRAIAECFLLSFLVSGDAKNE